MKRRSFVTVFTASLSLAFTVVAPRAAHATQLSAEDCRAKTRPCTCSDGPFMEVFLKNQQASREAWSKVYDTIDTPTGPTSANEAKTAHDKLFSGDPRVITQYKTCPSFDPNADLTQFAGAPGPGELWVDQCACEAFCSDIIEATITHEKSHPTTIILGAVNYSISIVMCAAGAADKSLCDQVEPKILAGSELVAYTLGNHQLEGAIEDLLETKDPAKPTELCTWQPIASVTRPSSEAVPESLWARLVNLAGRFWSGVAA